MRNINIKYYYYYYRLCQKPCNGPVRRYKTNNALGIFCRNRGGTKLQITALCIKCAFHGLVPSVNRRAKVGIVDVMCI